jgi:hypothetical protein
VKKRYKILNLALIIDMGLILIFFGFGGGDYNLRPQTSIVEKKRKKRFKHHISP